MTLEEALDVMKLQREALDSASDRLNEALTQAENAIKDLRLGVAATVFFKDGKHKLAFSKTDQQWQLTIEYPNSEYASVRNAPRSLRLQVPQLLPALAVALVEAVKVEAHRVGCATVDLEQFIDSIRLSRGEEVKG